MLSFVHKFPYESSTVMSCTWRHFACIRVKLRAKRDFHISDVINMGFTLCWIGLCHLSVQFTPHHVTKADWFEISDALAQSNHSLSQIKHWLCWSWTIMSEICHHQRWSNGFTPKKQAQPQQIQSESTVFRLWADVFVSGFIAATCMWPIDPRLEITADILRGRYWPPSAFCVFVRTGTLGQRCTTEGEAPIPDWKELLRLRGP